MPTVVSAYQCKWCNKVARTMSGILNHERTCHANPEFNCCENCNKAEMYAGTARCTYHDEEIGGKGSVDATWFLECDEDDDLGCTRKTPYTCHGFKSKGTHGFIKQEETK